MLNHSKFMIKNFVRLRRSVAAVLLLAASAQAATITHQITHHWATNYWEFVPAIAVPGIPPFNS